MTQLLIDHATLITLDPERRIIEDGAIVIVDDRIASIGARDEVSLLGTFDQRIDASRMVALPGLIDCHAHAGHSLVKSLGTDLGDNWNRACELIYSRYSTEAFWRADAALSSLERLKFGVTCGVSLFGGGNDVYRSDHEDFARQRVEVIEAIGVRDVLALGPCKPPYPTQFLQWAGAETRSAHLGLNQQLQTTEKVIDAYHASAAGRMRICVVSPVVHPRAGMGPDAGVWREQAVLARALSREHGVLFTQDGHREGSVAYAHDELDILGPDVLFSHSVNLTPREVQIVAETGTRIVHNPSAIASIMGRCPVPELLDAGASVVIGSDASAPDRSGDLFRHMQQCMHYHRRHFQDPKILPPGKTLEMVTIDAADALGLAVDIGSLEVGKKADVILLDLFKPHTYPLQMPLYRTVYYANGNDVDTVIVDGKILMQGRRVTTVDEAQVLYDADREARLALERSGLSALLIYPDRIWGHTRF